VDGSLRECASVRSSADIPEHRRQTPAASARPTTSATPT
jgi:hypothetical protein